jgi:outer membrane beta-barrel protein
MTLRPNAARALALALVAAAALLPRAAAASKADAFEGKIQPVSGQLYRKAGRLEITAGGDMSLNDAFFTKYFGDLKLGYHFTEHWSASLHAATGTAVATASTTVCPTGESCRDAYDYELYQVPGRIRTLLGAEVAWSPIYGKLNAFSEKVGHFDLSLLAGIDYVIHDEVLSSVDADAGLKPKTLRTVGGHGGVGARLFLSEAFAVRLDLKNYVYFVTVPNGELGPDQSELQTQLVAELGVSFFFPTTNRRQP